MAKTGIINGCIHLEGGIIRMAMSEETPPMVPDHIQMFVKSDTERFYLDGHGNRHRTSIDDIVGPLGEVKMFALSLAGAKTKAELQSEGWAICDGTTPTSQGITDADITETPNLENKFIRGSDDESSGSTGGLESITLAQGNAPAAPVAFVVGAIEGVSSGEVENKPPYYELAYFIKVKL